jgi:uncharacterized membrane protein YhiD involved in acid resistance
MDAFINFLFSSVITAAIDAKSFMLCTLASVLIGALVAFTYTYKTKSSKNFTITIALLPLVVQVVIMLVNNSLGAGIAVAGAFSLTRFRSVPGTAKEICAVFATMAVGLATGMGFIWVAAVFTAIMVVFTLFYTLVGFGKAKSADRELKITIPENIDYTNLFDDLMKKYTSFNELVRVRTVNMGSLFQLVYKVRLRDVNKTKQFLDELRCRNGNLDIICTLPAYGKEEL